MTTHGGRNNQSSNTSNTSSSGTTNHLKLEPEAVRRRASSIPGCVELVTPISSTAMNKKKSPTKAFGGKLGSPTKNNSTNPTITFLVGVVPNGTMATTRGIGSTTTNKSTGSGNVEDLARITIYCDTGTIATGRVCNGTIRHIFRRNVTSLDVVERCLKYPAVLPQIDWQLVSMTDTTTTGSTPTSPRTTTNNHAKNNPTTATATQDKSSMKQNLELCDVGLAILQSEKEKLVAHSAALTYTTTAATTRNAITSSSAEVASSSSIAVQVPAAGAAALHDNSNSNNSNNNKQPQMIATTPVSSPPLLYNTNNNVAVVGPAPTSGMEFQFSLAERPMKHVDQCLTDIQKMNKIVHAVSTNGIGTVFLYGNGGVAYTPNIPRTLYQKLSQLRYSKVHSSRPQYVSLGSRERYFVAFHDGTVSYKGPKGLDRELRKLTPPPLPSSSSTTSTTPTNSSNGNNNNNSYNSSGTPQNKLSKQISSASSFISAKFSDHQQSQHQSSVSSSNAAKQLWPLRSVAFGSSYDTFCIVFQDGSYKYQGKTFPKDLEDVLVKISTKRIPIVVDTDDAIHDALHSESSRLHHQPQSPSSIPSARRTGKVTGSENDGDDNYPPQHFYNNKKKSDEHEKKLGSRLVPNISSLSSFQSTATTNNNSNNNKSQPYGAGSGTVLSSTIPGGSSIMCITLGPSGEWFLRTESGHMEWGGISEEMDEAVQQLLEDGHRLNYFDFGEDLSYFVSYD